MKSSTNIGISLPAQPVGYACDVAENTNKTPKNHALRAKCQQYATARDTTEAIKSREFVANDLRQQGRENFWLTNSWCVMTLAPGVVSPGISSLVGSCGWPDFAGLFLR